VGQGGGAGDAVGAARGRAAGERRRPLEEGDGAAGLGRPGERRGGDVGDVVGAGGAAVAGRGQVRRRGGGRGGRVDGDAQGGGGGRDVAGGVRGRGGDAVRAGGQGGGGDAVAAPRGRAAALGDPVHQDRHGAAGLRRA